MECILLYLDDLEDWFYALALVGERLRRGLQRLFLVVVAGIAQVLMTLLTLREPAVGAAIAALLTVAIIYRSATAPIQAEPRRA